MDLSSMDFSKIDLSSIDLSDLTRSGPFAILGSNYTANYENPATLVPTLIGVSAASVSISLIFLLLRLWSRLRLVGRMEVDDWILIVAWLLSVFLSFSVSWSTLQAVGLHWYDIPPESLKYIPSFPGQYAAMILYTVVTQLIKTAVLIFYMRLTPSRKFKLVCKLVLVLITLGSLGTLPLMVFTCNPIKTMWDPKLFFRVALMQMGFQHSTIDFFLTIVGVEGVAMRPKCLNFLLLWKACAAINMSFDFVLLILPLPVIYRSGIPWKQKLHVILLFLLGIIVCMASVFRLLVLMEAEKSFLDASWIGAKVEAWTVTEANLGLIVACLPNVRRLLSHYCPRYFNILPKQHGFTGYEDDGNSANQGSHSFPVHLDSLPTKGANGDSKNHLVGSDEGDFTAYNQTRRLSSLSSEFDSADHEGSGVEDVEIINETTECEEMRAAMESQGARITEELELERRIRRLRSTDNDLQNLRKSGDPEPPLPV